MVKEKSSIKDDYDLRKPIVDKRFYWEGEEVVRKKIHKYLPPEQGENIFLPL
jgi:hypothetical protein